MFTASWSDVSTTGIACVIVCPWHPGVMGAKPVAPVEVWVWLDKPVYDVGSDLCGFPWGETPLNMSKKVLGHGWKDLKALEEDPRRDRTGVVIGLVE